MAISIGSNITSLQAQRRLDSTGGKLSQAFNKLSSGYRINRGADDAAGLAIAESLKAQSRIAGQAIRNTNDGISTIAIADGALGEVANILARLAELASKSANGTLSTTQRSVVSNEFVALSSEIERIAAVTEFNGIKLLSGTNNITIQVGTGSGVSSQIGYTNQLATLQGIGLGNAGGALTYSINLGVTRENLVAAESRIRDVDVAEEAANLTRLNILQQAGTAVLAQANQLPSLALQLLR